MKPKANISVYFPAGDDQVYFLFQVINFGREKDELKFIFTDPNEIPFVSYNEGGSHFGQEGVFGMFTAKPEVTYHSDGSLLQKLFPYGDEQNVVYRNPHGEGVRRTPLDEIDFWQPLIQYKVYNYEKCRKGKSTNQLILPQNPYVFDGDAFACRLFIGGKHNSTPKPNPGIVSYRIDNAASSVDILVIVFKLDKQAERIWIGKNRIPAWSKSNILQILDGNWNPRF